MSKQELIILISGIDLYAKKYKWSRESQKLRDKLHKQLIYNLNN